MDSVAFLIGHYSIYWSTVIVAFAAAVGVFLFWFFYLWDEPDVVGAFCVVPLALGLGVVLARLCHWYFRQDSYRSLQEAMTDYSVGGLALMGAFAGCFLAACLAALVRRGRHFGAMLDAMSVAGAGAVSLGRQRGDCCRRKHLGQRAGESKHRGHGIPVGHLSHPGLGDGGGVSPAGWALFLGKERLPPEGRRPILDVLPLLWSRPGGAGLHPV